MTKPFFKRIVMVPDVPLDTIRDEDGRTVYDVFLERWLDMCQRGELDDDLEPSDSE